MQWLWYLERMEDERIFKKIVGSKPNYKKKRGIPMKRWREAMSIGLKEKNVTELWA